MSNKLISERVFPAVFAAAVGAIFLLTDFRIEAGKLDGLLNSSINVSAILMGFLGTAKAMLLSFRSPKYTWLKSRTAVWQILLGYFRSALLANFVLCILSVLLLSVSAGQFPDWLMRYQQPLWAFVFTYAISCFYRVLLVFFALLKSE